jgi:hypothetical protein
VARHRLDVLIEEETGGVPAPRRFRRIVVIAFGVGLGVLIGVTAWAVTRGGGPATLSGGAGDTATSTPDGSDLPYTAGVGSGLPGPTRPPSVPPPRTLPPGLVAVFAADYETTSQSAGGFRGEVSVRNTGTGSGQWTVVVVLPPAANLADVWNARYERTGRTVRFHGLADLAAGQTTSFGFRVDTKQPATGPESCSIDGRPCG